MISGFPFFSTQTYNEGFGIHNVVLVTIYLQSDSANRKLNRYINHSSLKIQDSTSKPHYLIFNCIACSTRNIRLPMKTTIRQTFLLFLFFYFLFIGKAGRNVLYIRMEEILTLWTDWVFHTNKMNNRNRMHN